MKQLKYVMAGWLVLSGCQPRDSGQSEASAAPESATGSASAAQLNPDGLVLPQGFGAQVFAAGVGSARHLVTRANGDVYVRLESPHQGKTLVALRDADHDGVAETIRYFGPETGGSGLAIDTEYLYYSTATEVFRQALAQSELIPSAEPERIVMNLGSEGMHNARSLALDGQHHLFVNVGAPSNSCQVLDRMPASPGKQPCPLLEAYAGVWRFATDKPNQDKLKDGLRFAGGIRNAVALEWNQNLQRLFLLQHGRDQLYESWGKYYTAQQGAELPSEEFTDVEQGDNLGWPYCYHDPSKQKLMLAPEYGGDGSKTGDCGQYKSPLVGFPAHYAPNDLLFYTGRQFPAEYAGGALIAFHGSWNRGQEQAGFNVVFQPLKQGRPSGKYTIFAQGFAGRTLVTNPGQARYRPMGLTQQPDGSVLIGDSVSGRIWRVHYSARP